MEQPPVIRQPRQQPPRFPIWLALGANIANFLLSIQFYSVASGARIRPEAWALWVFCVGIAGFISIPFVLPALRTPEHRSRSRLTIVLGVTPFPLALAMLYHSA